MPSDLKHIKQIKLLTGNDILRINFYFDKKKGKIIRFSLQYEALIENKKHIILRVDNAHADTLPHKHVFHKSGKEIKVFINKDPHSVFNQEQRIIIRDFGKIKENYLFSS